MRILQQFTYYPFNFPVGLKIFKINNWGKEEKKEQHCSVFSLSSFCSVFAAFLTVQVTDPQKPLLVRLRDWVL